MSLAVELTVEAAAGGRSRVVARLGADTLHVAEFNLGSDVSRERFLKRLGEVAPALAGDGLEVLRQRLVAEAAKPRPKAEAAELPQGQAVTFEKVEPWEEPVDGALLLDAMTRTVTDYVVLPSEAHARMVALWCLHAWVFRAFTITPRLCVRSAEWGSGKTTLLDIVKELVPRGLIAANASPAAIFRVIAESAPTVLLDECDHAFRSESGEDLRRIANAGHRRDGVVLRTVGEDFTVAAFPVFGPLALGLIGELPGTLRDRSVTVTLCRKTRAERVKPLPGDRIDGELLPLRRQAARWASDNIEGLRGSDPTDLPESLWNRRRDNWLPLVAVGDRAGGEWGRYAREAAQAIEGLAGDEPSHGSALLADFRALFAARGRDRLATVEIVEQLNRLDERAWPAWNRGRGIASVDVARLLKPYGIRPGTVRLSAAPDDTAKGYSLESFADAFARYLPEADAGDRSMGGTPGPGAVTTSQPAETLAPRAIASRHTDDLVTAPNRPPSPENGRCDGVTAENHGGAERRNGPPVEPCPPWFAPTDPERRELWVEIDEASRQAQRDAHQRRATRPASAYLTDDQEERLAVQAEGTGRPVSTSTTSPPSWRSACRTCGGRRWWTPTGGTHRVCGRCHPPAPGLGAAREGAQA